MELTEKTGEPEFVTASVKVPPIEPAARSGSGADQDATFLQVMFEAGSQLTFAKPLPDLLETIMDLAAAVIPYERGAALMMEKGVAGLAVVGGDSGGRRCRSAVPSSAGSWRDSRPC